MAKIFIDGGAGTTGLRLADRLKTRDDIDLITIGEANRKDMTTRLQCISEADVTFLCLPDESAVETVKAIKEAGLKDIKIIDCSAAFRTEEGWLYGMPEVHGGKGYNDRNITRHEDRGAVWIANPGCHATGFIMSVRPLADAGIIDPDAVLCFHSITGYSGGGKSMIAEYKRSFEELRGGTCTEGNGAVRTENKAEARKMNIAPRQYALNQQHKHLAEMQKYSSLSNAPVFSPIVCDFYNGMLVGVPLPRSALRRRVPADEIRDRLTEYYKNCPLVKVRAEGYEFSEISGGGFLSADAFKDRDDIELIVTGNEDRIEIISRYDNLGKGASGAAIQNMNLILGLAEETGLVPGD